jgi:hypothetical protein
MVELLSSCTHWLVVCLNTSSVSSNDGSYDAGMMGWPTSSMNSLRVLPKKIA